MFSMKKKNKIKQKKNEKKNIIAIAFSWYFLIITPTIPHNSDWKQKNFQWYLKIVEHFVLLFIELPD